MIEVFIPFSNTKVWKPPLTNAASILSRLRQKQSGELPKAELQETFEEWAVANMNYDWGLLRVDGGMKFQFERTQEATYFKLVWA